MIIQPIILLIVTTLLLAAFFYIMLAPPFSEPISIQQYRGAGLMGVLVGICLWAAFFAGRILIKSISQYRSGDSIYILFLTEKGEKLLSDLRQKTKSSVAAVIVEALLILDRTVDQEQQRAEIQTRMAKRPTPDFIRIVVDNTKKDKN